MRPATSEELADLCKGIKQSFVHLETRDAYGTETELPHIEKWIVTEVPLTVEDADAFVPENYLGGFNPTASKELGGELRVQFYERA